MQVIFKNKKLFVQLCLPFFLQLIYDAGVSFQVIMWVWSGLAGFVFCNCFLNWPTEGFPTPDEVDYRLVWPRASSPPEISTQEWLSEQSSVCEDPCTFIYVCIWMYMWLCMCLCDPCFDLFFLVTAWVLNYSCVYVCVQPMHVCVCVCVKSNFLVARM